MAWGLAEQDAEKRGYNAGIADGAEQKAIDTAKKMLLNLIPVDVIAECTGLPLETIQKLAEIQE